jgi:hypothetical protein
VLRPAGRGPAPVLHPRSRVRRSVQAVRSGREYDFLQRALAW